MAAADAAEGNGAPPPELEMAWDSAKFNIPPFSGGRADQPAGLLKRMRVLSNVYDAMQTAKEYNRTGRIKEFHDHPSYSTYIEVTKMRNNNV